MFDRLWYDQMQPHLAIDHLFSMLRATNEFFNRHEPWHLKNSKDVSNVLAVTAESLRLCSLLLRPLIPEIALRALDRLGMMNIHNSNWHLNSKWDLGCVKGPLVHRITL